MRERGSAGDAPHDLVIVRWAEFSDRLTDLA